MKIAGNDIRPGNLLRHKERLWKVLKTQHIKPGKGPAYMQAEMKELRVGTKLNERFRSSEMVEKIQVDEATYQYLYPEGEACVFMHKENYEQLSVESAVLGDAKNFLTENMDVDLRLFEGQVLEVKLPASVIVAVAEADPVVKGQTASASFKPAVLDNGVKIMVPPHIEQGARIAVDPEALTYIERAKQ